MTEYLTKKKAVNLIVDRAEKPPHEDKSARRNKVNQRLTRGIESGEVKQSGGKVSFDDVAAHARKRYGDGLFKDFPVPVVIHVPCGKLKLTAGEPLVYTAPGNLEECRALIGKLYAEIAELDKVIAGLRPDAERWRATVNQNRINGNKPKN